MWTNNANCDIYIGKEAGTKLLKEIGNATKSVKIVSPYLSPSLIKELIYLKERNIDIELITSDDIEDFYGSYDKNILKLIIQNKATDEKAVEIRNKWKDLTKILTYINFGIIALLLVLFYFLKNEKIALGVIPVVVIYLIIQVFNTKIKNKRIFHYSYSQLFPFKVFMSPGKTDLSDPFIHSKIYLIDDRVAYLGSLNLTVSGTKYNYETRIRTTDNEAIEKIIAEIDELFYSDLPERDIEYWGKQLYKEPIN